MANSLNNLTTLYTAQENDQEGHHLMREAQRRTDRFLENVLLGASEKTRQSYLQQQENTSNVYLSLLAQLAHEQAGRDAESGASSSWTARAGPPPFLSFPLIHHPR